MATSNVSADSNEIVSEIYINAPPDRVFQALVDPEQVVKWWGQKGIYQCTEFAGEVRAGGSWHSAGVGPDGSRFEVKGEYLEVDRPRVLSTTWLSSWTGEKQTVVRWELSPSQSGTVVRIRHSGFAAHPELLENYRGWPRMLGWLQSYVDTGETVESRKAASWS